jgi:hypothetical protein
MAEACEPTSQFPQLDSDEEIYISFSLVTRPLKNFPVPGRSTYQHWGVQVTLYSEHCQCLDCEQDHYIVSSFYVRGGAPQFPLNTEICDNDFVLDLEIGERHVIRPRVRCYIPNEWKKQSYLGV